jgi:hypothetical protein
MPSIGRVAQRQIRSSTLGRNSTVGPLGNRPEKDGHGWILASAAPKPIVELGTARRRRSRQFGIHTPRPKGQPQVSTTSSIQ